MYRRRLLSLSETFIRQQAVALRRWSPVLVGEQPVHGGIDLAGLDVRWIPGPPATGWRTLPYRACRWLGIPHPPMVRALRGIGASLVHVHFGTDAVDVFPHVQACGLPMLVTLHGYDVDLHAHWWRTGHGGARRRRYPEQLRRMARMPSVRFVAVSEAVRARGIEVGIPGDKLVVAHVGVDTDFFYPGDAPFADRDATILFVGRLVENKGAEVMLEAVARAAPGLPGVGVVIVGDGPLRGRLEALAARLGVPVRFTGALDRSGVRSEMRRARLFCQPSVTIASGASEAFGIALLEAQACGLPAVSSSRGGSREGLRDGVTGHRFEEGNVEALARLLVDYFAAPGRAGDMSRAAATFVREAFGQEACTVRLEAAYDAAAGRTGE